MASTSSGLARQQLRQITSKPRSIVVSTPSCSYSTTALTRHIASRRKIVFSSAHSDRRELSVSATWCSSWPASAVTRPEPHLGTSVERGKSRSIPSPPRSKTIADLAALKASNTPIVCLTAYDYPSALSIRSADIDLCLVGDSLANVALGFSSTQSLSLDAMIHHAKAVKRGLDAPLLSAGADAGLPRSPLVIADVPFGVTFSSVEEGVKAVVRLIHETGVDGVKIEGEHEVLDLIKRLTDHGILVMGHIGLQPQRVGSTSGYRVQGKTAQHAKQILETAQALEAAGCFSLVLECIPTRLGEFISQQLRISTIGIGAGSKTDGQILVTNDMIGDLTGAGHVLAALADQPVESSQSDVQQSMPMTSSLTPPPPKFVRNFCSPSTTSIGALRIAAVQGYEKAVRERSFPNDEIEGYKIKADEWRSFLDLTRGQSRS